MDGCICMYICINREMRLCLFIWKCNILSIYIYCICMFGSATFLHSGIQRINSVRTTCSYINVEVHVVLYAYIPDETNEGIQRFFIYPMGYQDNNVVPT